MHRSEEIELPGGMSMERMTSLNGATAWEDMKQRGGMGGGMQMVIATGPGRGGNSIRKRSKRRAFAARRTELMRYLLAFFGGATLQPTWVAVAEAPDGKADVLEAKNEGGATVRIFVDQQTHLPLMLQYQEVRPRMMIDGPGGPGRGGPGGGGRGGGGGRERRRRARRVVAAADAAAPRRSTWPRRPSRSIAAQPRRDASSHGERCLRPRPAP